MSVLLSSYNFLQLISFSIFYSAFFLIFLTFFLHFCFGSFYWAICKLTKPELNLTIIFKTFISVTVYFISRISFIWFLKSFNLSLHHLSCSSNNIVFCFLVFFPEELSGLVEKTPKVCHSDFSNNLLLLLPELWGQLSWIFFMRVCSST